MSTAIAINNLLDVRTVNPAFPFFMTVLDEPEVRLRQMPRQ